MPAIQYYEVEQKRVVRVTATNILDATKIAGEAFDAAKNNEDKLATAPDGVMGNVLGNVEVIQLDISKEL